MICYSTGVRARSLAAAVLALALTIDGQLGAAVPPPSTEQAEAAAAQGLHAKAGAIFLELFERTKDKALLRRAALAFQQTGTDEGRTKAVGLLEQYAKLCRTPEEQAEARTLLEQAKQPPSLPAPLSAGPAPTGPAAPAGPEPPPIASELGPAPAPPALPVEPPSPPAVEPRPWSPGPGWGAQGYAPVLGPPPAPPPPPAGITAAGLPIAQRGRILLDSASYLNTEGHEGAASFILRASVPVMDRLLVEGALPIGLPEAWGNPTIGAHYVAQIGGVEDGLWITAGGAIGIPLIPDSSETKQQAIPRALWDAHHFWGDIVPLQVRLRLEYHVSIFELRAELEPSLWSALGNRDEAGGAFQHALELQLGHEIGGGLRIQGVLASIAPRIAHPNDPRPIDDDHYQFALSPYFSYNRGLGTLRIGLMIPMDPVLAPPFENSWGFLFAGGVNLD